MLNTYFISTYAATIRFRASCCTSMKGLGMCFPKMFSPLKKVE
jgi:hypothetical protein